MKYQILHKVYGKVVTGYCSLPGQFADGGKKDRAFPGRIFKDAPRRGSGSLRYSCGIGVRISFAPGIPTGCRERTVTL